MQGFTYKHGDRPLAGYTIQRAAGRGGFGEVYYALSDAGREVALKAVQGYETIELRGIAQCMNLKSPHLVTIFDVKYNEQERPFVIMEYVAGPGLRELLDEAPAGLGTQKAAFFLREIAKGLTYLHDRGIVHRDLKPGNVFYEDGYVKIGDYGLSKSISASKHSGQTITVGTVHYMAPEIGRGRYDRSIDIYALGCMLYEMLTGSPPYLGGSPGEILMKHVTAQPDLTGIAEPFATVIRKALAKDPKGRYASVQEMVEAVFGAAHIQQSVSVFSPESLTMVAGRVTRKVGAGGPGSSGQTMGVGGYGRARPDGSGQGDWADQVGQRLARIGEHIGERLDAVGERIGARLAGRMPPRTPSAADAPGAGPQVDVRRDPLGYGARLVLGAAAGALLALGAAVMGMPPSGDADTIAWHFLLSGSLVLGASLGLLVAARLLGRAMALETGFIRRLSVGALGSSFGLLAAAPALVAAFGLKPGRVGGTVLAVLVPLFVLDWLAVTDPARRRRLSLRPVFLAVLVALIVSAIRDGNTVLAVGTVAAIALAVQVVSPFHPRGVGDPAQARSAEREQPRPAHGADGSARRAAVALHAANVSTRKRLWALLLTVPGLLLVCGLQRFYVGKIFTGILWLLTYGLLGMGQLYDAIMIALGRFRDRHGRRLVVWESFDELTAVANASMPGWRPGAPAGAAAAKASDGPLAGAGVAEAMAPGYSGPPAAEWSTPIAPRRQTNLALAALGGIALVPGMLLGVTSALGAPAITALGVYVPEIARQAWYQTLFAEGWIQLVTPLEVVLSSVLVFLAAALLIVARRRAGGAHMVRAAVGSLGMLLSLYVLRLAMRPETDRIAQISVGRPLGDALEEIRRETWLFTNTHEGGIVIAGIVMLASIMILAWPPRRVDVMPPVGKGV